MTEDDERSGDRTGKSEDRPGESKGKSRKQTVAVALGYESERDDAPRVIAGGRGAVAEQILEIAFASGVKVREDADLAQMLSAIDIDSEIPVEAFVAVAEILAYVYRASGAMPPHPEDSGGNQEARP